MFVKTLLKEKGESLLNVVVSIIRVNRRIHKTNCRNWQDQRAFLCPASAGCKHRTVRKFKCNPQPNFIHYKNPFVTLFTNCIDFISSTDSFTVYKELVQIWKNVEKYIYLCS